MNSRCGKSEIFILFFAPLTPLNPSDTPQTWIHFKSSCLSIRRFYCFIWHVSYLFALLIVSFSSGEFRINSGLSTPVSSLFAIVLLRKNIFFSLCLDTADNFSYQREFRSKRKVDHLVNVERSFFDGFSENCDSKSKSIKTFDAVATTGVIESRWNV